jgi:glycerol-3-phosphate acyltransferase PlsY
LIKSDGFTATQLFENMTLDFWPLLAGFGLWITFAYLCGSISFAVVVSRLFGLSDPRTFGSHNPGATNVLRTGHKGAALLTLFMDGFKAWLPLVLAKTYVLQNPFLDPLLKDYALDVSLWQTLSPWIIGLVAISAFLGHLWPVFFGFKGGKGVATAAGLLLGMHPMLGLMALLTWVSVAVITRYSSLSALISAALAPLYLVLGANYLWSEPGANVVPWPMVMVSSIMAALLIYRHKDNVARLIRGEESKIFSKKGG